TGSSGTLDMPRRSLQTEGAAAEAEAAAVPARQVLPLRVPLRLRRQAGPPAKARQALPAAGGHPPPRRQPSQAADSLAEAAARACCPASIRSKLRSVTSK